MRTKGHQRERDLREDRLKGEKDLGNMPWEILTGWQWGLGRWGAGRDGWKLPGRGESWEAESCWPGKARVERLTLFMSAVFAINGFARSLHQDSN